MSGLCRGISGACLPAASASECICILGVTDSFWHPTPPERTDSADSDFRCWLQPRSRRGHMARSTRRRRRRRRGGLTHTTTPGQRNEARRGLALSASCASRRMQLNDCVDRVASDLCKRLLCCLRDPVCVELCAFDARLMCACVFVLVTARVLVGTMCVYWCMTCASLDMRLHFPRDGVRTALGSAKCPSTLSPRRRAPPPGHRPPRRLALSSPLCRPHSHDAPWGQQTEARHPGASLSGVPPGSPAPRIAPQSWPCTTRSS